MKKRLTKKQKEALKAKAITDLFNSKQLDEKIDGVLWRNYLPMQADLGRDVLQTVFENLSAYNTDKFCEAYTDNPKRILALAVRIMINKGIYLDKRSGKGYNASIAQQIVHQSSLTNISLSTTKDYDEENNNTLINKAIATTPNEDENADMWEWVQERLTNEENNLLELALDNPINKLKKGLQMQIQLLYPKLQQLITEYRKLNN